MVERVLERRVSTFHLYSKMFQSAKAATDIGARGSRNFKVHCDDEVALPNCTDTACNSTL